MKQSNKHRLSPDQLINRLPPFWLPFKNTTKELKPRQGVVGQERAMRAIEVGLRIQTRGYNIYLAGEAGSGKTSNIERLLNERSSNDPVPADLCYVHNFRAPNHPLPIQLPAGMGLKFAKDMANLVEDLSRMVPRVLSDGAFGHYQTSILAKTHAKVGELTRRISKAAEAVGLRLSEEEDGLHLIPLHKGQPLDQEAFEQLSAAKQRKIEATIVGFQEHLDAYSYRRRQLEVDHQNRMRAAEVRVITPLLEGMFGELIGRYHRQGNGVVEYLKEAMKHVLENHRAFLPDEDPEEMEGETDSPDPVPHRIYQVNVVVDRTGQQGASVIKEPVPNPVNLCGCSEYRAEQGRLITDHMMIRAGALHQANGGYLVLQMGDLLGQENAWECLKRALRHKQIRIEEEANLIDGRVRMSGMMKPGTVPLKVKVLLIGGHEIYYLLKLEDEDFSRLFKIKAEFEESMPRTPANVKAMARFLGKVCLEEGYLPVHSSGMVRILELASRMAEHKDRLTTHLAGLLDILAESSFFARESRARSIRQLDVDRAMKEITWRHASSSDAVDREIHEGSILIRTRGSMVGQINGIALYDMVSTSFGVPVRITIRTYAGRRGVVNIDREVNLSGAIHDKGAMILVGYMGGRFAQKQTLGFSASITFEQSYDEIDGDSASSAELYGLLSSLSGCPIHQGISVTGSVNQLGEIQPIGGVNEKIEGIYRVCKGRGLIGEEGVMIPRANVKNLMLDAEVIDAVRRKKFHIYAVSTIDEGIEVLTGVSAGRRRKDGFWTPGSINDRVERRLAELQRVIRSEGVKTAYDREI